MLFTKISQHSTLSYSPLLLIKDKMQFTVWLFYLLLIHKWVNLNLLVIAEQPFFGQ